MPSSRRSRSIPNQADGLHGYSQFLAAMGRHQGSRWRCASICRRSSSSSSITLRTPPKSIGSTAIPKRRSRCCSRSDRGGRSNSRWSRPRPGRYREAAAALREMPATELSARECWRPRRQSSNSAPAKAAAPAALPRLGNMSFAYMHVGAPERVLEFYEDEIAGRLFPADLRHLVLASDLRGGAPDRAIQEGGARSRPRRLLARTRLAGAMPPRGRGRFRLRVIQTQDAFPAWYWAHVRGMGRALRNPSRAAPMKRLGS